MNKIIDNDFLKKFLEKSIDNKKYYNILLYGLPGCGKTTIVRTYLNKLYDNKNHYIEINSSDNRGINYYKDILQKFINNTNIKNKTFFLDEADNLTHESQKYINYILEYISENNLDTNFIIICNYVNKIDEKILNKCFTFRIKKINTKSISKIFNEKCIDKNLKIKNKKKILKSINNNYRELEYFFNFNNYNINLKNNEKMFKELLKILLDKNITYHNKYEKIDILIENDYEYILDDFLKYCLNETYISKSNLIDIFYKLKQNIGLDYIKKIKIYEIIFSFDNI